MKFKADARPDGGDFASGKLAWDVLKLAARHNSSLPTSIDLSDCPHLKPYAIACLAAVGARAGGMLPLTLPKDDACREHLLRLGLHKWFQLDGPPTPVEVRPTNVPIERRTTVPGDFSSRAMDVWVNEAGGAAVNLHRHFADHLDEMILNALGHSDSPVGCFVVGQAFPTAGRVEVAILDLGVTILGHLSKHPKYCHLSADHQAISTAFLEGVTGTLPGHSNRLGQPNSGVGLSALHRFCQMGNASFTVVSGSAYVTIDGDSKSVYSMHTPFAGTLVNIRFRTEIDLPSDSPDEIIGW